MEIYFLVLLILLMASALGSGYPVAFALPGSAIVTVLAAAASGWLFEGNIDAYFAHGGPGEWLSAGVTNLRGVYWEVERDTLIAIPLFIFMGIMLQRSKIAEDLLVTMAQLFGPIRGGLGISVVFVGALLAATTGIVGATVVAMGLISLPAMLRNNYSKSLATGTIAASGTLGQIIPPSIVLIILADQLSSAVDQASTARKALYKVSTGELSMPSEFDVASTSAGEMFLGALVPGLVLVALYMIYILVYAQLRPRVAPAVHQEGRFDGDFWFKVAITLIPPLALIFLVLGSILMGVATVNQAGAIGAAGALIMAGYRLTEGKRGQYVPAIIAIISLVVITYVVSTHDTNIKNIKTEADAFGIMLAAGAVGTLALSLLWSGIRVMRIDNTLQAVMLETAKTTSLVFIILLGAAMLTASFRAFGGEDLVRHFLETLPGGFWSQFIIVMSVIFFLGFFLDFIEIAVVVVPIVTPILLSDPAANVTAVWLGVMIGLNIQTSFLTPPFGFALFYLRGVAPPSVLTTDIYKGVVPFIALQLLALAIAGYYPSLVNYLPTRVSLTSQTAPPPINPRLQPCIEEMVFAIYAKDEDRLRKAIDDMAGIDLSTLSDDARESVEKGIESARSVFDRVKDVETAVAEAEAFAVEYRPMHQHVSDIQRLARQIETELDDLKRESTLIAANSSDESAAATRMKERIVALENEHAAIVSQIPTEWPDKHKAYLKIVGTENRARGQYRRAVDDAYSGIAEVRLLLSQAEQITAVRGDIEALRPIVESGDITAAQEAIGKAEDTLGALNDVGPIRSPLSKARRALKSGPEMREEALGLLDQSLEAQAAEAQWRTAAAASVGAALDGYDLAIRDTFGLRQQSRLGEDQAKEVAACMSHHRDISLNF
ncbi:MAG: TRAP transporter large permease subunit [Geminicoccaceae bacterium]|nr:TRAP transporter large permease subunit [Geminicoccaceae bacterium]